MHQKEGLFVDKFGVGSQKLEGKVLNFERLEAYKKAVDFVNWVYEITKNFPKIEQFGIISQLRRAALSISLNIAEGAGRYNKKEKRQFYRMARASAFECIPLFEISKRQKLLKNEDYSFARGKCLELTKILSGLIKSVSTREED